MSKKYFYFILVLLSAHVYVLSAQQLGDCIKKVTDSYGGKAPSICPSGSEDYYYIVNQNICTYPIDIQTAVQDKSGEWIIFQKNNVSPNDTIFCSLCASKGLSKSEFKKVGDKSVFTTYEELNAEWLKTHPKKVTPQTKNMHAKVLYGEFIKKPLANQKVTLKDSNGGVLQSAITDQYGDFSFNKVNSSQQVEIMLEKNENLPKGEKVFIANQNGSVISEMQKDANDNFVYKVLPADYKKLETMQEDDPEIAVANFSKSPDKSIVISDNVYYEAGSTALLPSAQEKLDRIISIMKTNSGLSLEVASHTDAKGDDNINLKLSEERVKLAIEYMTSKGIDSKRISGKGYGESQILNRCKNGINCSEKEHQLNRRTEFKFIKK